MISGDIFNAIPVPWDFFLCGMGGKGIDGGAAGVLEDDSSYSRFFKHFNINLLFLEVGCSTLVDGISKSHKQNGG